MAKTKKQTQIKNKKKKGLTKGAKVGISLGCTIPVLAGAGVGVAYIVVNSNLITVESKVVESDKNHFATFKFEFKEKITYNSVDVSIVDSSGVVFKFKDGQKFDIVDQKLDISFEQSSIWTTNGKSNLSLLFKYKTGEEQREITIKDLEIHWINFITHKVSLEGGIDISNLDAQVQTEGQIKHNFKIMFDDQDVTDFDVVSLKLDRTSGSGVKIDKDYIYWKKSPASVQNFYIRVVIDGNQSDIVKNGTITFYGTSLKNASGKYNYSLTDSIPGFDKNNQWVLYKVDPDGKETSIPTNQVTFEITGNAPVDTEVDSEGLLKWYHDKPITPGTYNFSIKASTTDGKYVAYSNSIVLDIGTPSMVAPSVINVQKGVGGSSSTPIGQLVIKSESTGEEVAVPGVSYDAPKAEDCGVTIDTKAGTYSWNESANGKFNLKIQGGMYSTSQDIEVVPHNITITPSTTTLDWGLDNNNVLNFDFKDGDQEIQNAQFSVEEGYEGFKWDGKNLNWDETLSVDPATPLTFHVKGQSVGTTPIYAQTTETITINKQVATLEGNLNVVGTADEGKALEPIEFQLNGVEQTEGVNYVVTSSGDPGEIDVKKIDGKDYIVWNNSLSQGVHSFKIKAKKGLYEVGELNGSVEIVYTDLRGPDTIYIQAGTPGSSPEDNPFKLMVVSQEATLDSLTIEPKTLEGHVSADPTTGLISWDDTLTSDDTQQVTVHATGKTEDGHEYSDSKSVYLKVVDVEINGPSSLVFSENQSNIDLLNYDYQILVNGEAQNCVIDENVTNLVTEKLAISQYPDKKYHLNVTGTDPLTSDDFVGSNQITIGLIVSDGSYKGMKASITSTVSFVATSISGQDAIYGQAGIEGASSVYKLTVGGVEKEASECDYVLKYPGQTSRIFASGDGKIHWDTTTSSINVNSTLTVIETATKYVATKNVLIDLSAFTAQATTRTIVGYKGFAGSLENAFSCRLNGIDVVPTPQDTLTYSVENLEPDNVGKIYFENGTNKLIWTSDAVNESEFTVKVVYHAYGKCDYVTTIEKMSLTLEEVRIEEENGEYEFDVDGQPSNDIGKFHFMAGEEKHDDVDWSIDDSENFQIMSRGSYRTIWAKKQLTQGKYDVTITVSKNQEIYATKDVTINAHEFLVEEINISADNSEDFVYQCKTTLDGEEIETQNWGWRIIKGGKTPQDLGISNINANGQFTISKDSVIHISDETDIVLAVEAQIYDGLKLKYEAQTIVHIDFDEATLSGGSTDLVLNNDGNAGDSYAWKLTFGGQELENVEYSIAGYTGIEVLEGGSITLTSDHRVWVQKCSVGDVPGQIDVLAKCGTLEKHATVYVTKTADYTIYNENESWEADAVIGVDGKLNTDFVVKYGDQTIEGKKFDWNVYVDPSYEKNIFTISYDTDREKAQLGWHTQNITAGDYKCTISASLMGVGSTLVSREFTLHVYDPEIECTNNEIEIADDSSGDFTITVEYNDWDERIDYSKCELIDDYVNDIEITNVDSSQRGILKIKITYNNIHFTSYGSDIEGLIYLSFLCGGATSKFKITFKLIKE